MPVNYESVIAIEDTNNYRLLHMQDGSIYNMRSIDSTGNCFGNMYSFHENKNIRKYSLMLNDCYYMPYILYFNKNGKLSEQFGKPVFLVFGQEKDTLIVEYYISDFGYKSVKVILTDENIFNQEVKLVKYKKFPFIKKYTYKKNVKNLNTVFIVIKINGYFIPTNEKQEFLDTLSIERATAHNSSFASGLLSKY